MRKLFLRSPIIVILLGISLIFGGGVVVANIFFGGTSVNLQKGLVGHWKMDGNAKDSTPNSYHGTVTGATLTTDRKGQSNKAYSFNGTSDYIQIADNDIFSFGNGTTDRAFSISAWIKKNATGTKMIMGKTSTAALREWEFQPQATVMGMVIHDDSVNKEAYTPSSVAYGIGVWEHWVATYNGVGGSSAHLGIKLYQNGVDVTGTGSTQAGYVAMENQAYPVRIGARGDDAQYFDGNIDDARIYNRVLSQVEVTALYESYR